MEVVPRNPATQKTVVLIEDEEVILELLRAKLEGVGLRVRTARDGTTGFQLIKEIMPDLVFLDMLLPGLNGLQILEKMKTEGLLPALPVLIISNSGQPVELERAMELGARDYLIKVNFDPQEVLDRAQIILGTVPPSHPDKNTTGKSVLIVEDDVLLVNLLEQKFTSSGYAVQKALDVDQARRLLEKNICDAILLDLVLPGIDGFTYLTELKQDERYKKIPVVIVSNLGQQEEIDKGIRLGATDYIVKADSSPVEIVKKLTLLLNKPRGLARQSAV